MHQQQGAADRLQDRRTVAGVGRALARGKVPVEGMRRTRPDRTLQGSSRSLELLVEEDRAIGHNLNEDRILVYMLSSCYYCETGKGNIPPECLAKLSSIIRSNIDRALTKVSFMETRSADRL